MPTRVLSGMRPTGKLHLGHYHGVINNWKKLQQQHQCLFCIADWHALTTHYENSTSISENSIEVLIDWLVSGINPQQSILFLQSQVSQHAELHLALSMITPLGWLERVPTYKDQKEKLQKLDLSTYGFLGYPVLQTADILLYNAQLVPVGADQVAHIEMSREIARKFNYIFGRDDNFFPTKDTALAQLDSSLRKKLKQANKRYGEKGDSHILQQSIDAIKASDLNHNQQAVLIAWLENKGLSLLVEPQALLMEDASKIPGTDGQKMSKSYSNAIFIRDQPDRINKEIKKMPTDPARVHLTDAGNPEKCPVWNFHIIYTDKKERNRLENGCRNATIGCIDCKQIVCEKIIAENTQFNAKAQPYIQDRAQLLQILKLGNEQARDLATNTMATIRKSMHLLNGFI